MTEPINKPKVANNKRILSETAVVNCPFRDSPMPKAALKSNSLSGLNDANVILN